MDRGINRPDFDFSKEPVIFPPPTHIKIISTFHHTPYHVSLAFRYISNKMLDLNKLITERMPLKHLEHALEQQEAGKVIKVAIKPIS